MLRMSKVKRTIIVALQEREYQPVELLSRLELEHRFSEDILREALAQLTASREIELTRTRHLRLRNA